MIGLLGGMGPEASVDAYRLLVDLSYKDAGKDMGAYPHIVINNVPFPNLYQLPAEEARPMLVDAVRLLATAGCRVIGVCCNSAHHYFADMKDELEEADVVLVNMVDETVILARSKTKNGNVVGVLSSTLSREMYETGLTDQGLQCILPETDCQRQVDDLILRILSGEKDEKISHELTSMCKAMVAQGAEIVILGCTDLPLVLDEDEIGGLVVSSTQALVNALSKQSRSRVQNEHD